MEFELLENHTILDLISEIKKSKKKKFIIKVLSKESFLYQSKSRKLIKKASESLDKEILFQVQDLELYREIIRDGLRCEFINKKNIPIKDLPKKPILEIPNEDPERKKLKIIFSIFIAIIILSLQFSFANIRLLPSIRSKIMGMKLNFCKEECNLPFSVTYTPLDYTVEKEYDFVSTGQKFSGILSRGVATFYNLSNETWELSGGTRIQNEEGVLFRAQKKIIIPSASYKNGKLVPGEVEIPILAEENDAFGNIIGSRGNIDKGTFFLPGLRERYRGTVWAEIKKPTTGGSSSSTSIVTKKDIDDFIKYVKLDLVKLSLSKVQKEIPTHYPDFLINENFIPFFPLTINFEGLPEENNQIKSAKVKAIATVTFFLLPIDKIENIIKDFLEEHLIESIEELDSISLENLEIHSITPYPDNKDNFQGDIMLPYYIKRTFTLTDSEKTSIAKKLSGTTTEVARKLILDTFPHLRVEITSWPPWRKSLPFDPGQIKIKIVN